MKRWLFLLMRGFEALLVLAAIYFEPTHCVRGKIWGEAFFDGKPTSWWRNELERWEIIGVIVADPETFDQDAPPPWKRPLFRCNPNVSEKIQERWQPRVAEVVVHLPYPKLLGNDEAAIPVLRELLDDASLQVRDFAQIGLGSHPDYPRIKEKIEPTPFKINLWRAK